MKNFKDTGFRSGGKDFGGRSKFGGGTPSRGRKPAGSFGGGDRGARPQGKTELFTATCSSCRKSCEVPFRPSAGKPVYCSACFGVKNSDESRGSERSEFRPRSDARSERPSYGKSVREYSPSQSEAPRMQRDTGLEEVKQQLKTIEARLNRILDLINPPIQPTPSTKEKVEEKTEDVVVIPKKERKPKTAKKAVKKVAKKAKK